MCSLSPFVASIELESAVGSNESGTREVMP